MTILNGQKFDLRRLETLTRGLQKATVVYAGLAQGELGYDFVNRFGVLGRAVYDDVRDLDRTLNGWCHCALRGR